ncbi:hypothetical protein ACWGPC_60910, partial [Streptomyces mirabilis]
MAPHTTRHTALTRPNPGSPVPVTRPGRSEGGAPVGAPYGPPSEPRPGQQQHHRGQHQQRAGHPRQEHG